MGQLSIYSNIYKSQYNLIMTSTEDSYQQYKQYLEKSLGIVDIPAPHKPMNPYLRFFFERSCEERSKGETNWTSITKKLSEQWKNLAANKKEFYQRVYEVRVRERNSLYEQYEKLAKKKKPQPPYARYVKKRYAQYSKEYRNKTSSDINKMIKEDWKTISTKEKDKLNAEFQKEKADIALNIDNSDRIAEYKARVERYHEELKEEKEKIAKKYGVNHTTRIKERQLVRQRQREKKRAQKQLQRQQRKRLLQDEKRKDKESKAKLKKELTEAAKRVKEEEKQKEKDKSKIQPKQRSASKSKKATSKPKSVKKQSKPVVKKEVLVRVPAKKKIIKKPKKTPVKKAKASPVKKIATKKAAKPAKKGKTSRRGK